MFKHVTIVPKLNAPDSRRVQEVVDSVTIAAKDANLDVGFHRDAETIIVAIGGDGTMLEAMRASATTGAACLGINLGRVGFLTDINIETMTPYAFHNLLVGIFSGWINTWVEERRLLSGLGSDSPWSVLAGNEISVSTKESDSMICYRLKIGNMIAGVHRANSIMVSTATGSTAYSLSAGGSLMMPDLSSMQIVPVAPLTLTSRPIVVPSHHDVTIEAWGGPIAVRFDGSHHTDSDQPYTKAYPYSIQISSYASPARLLHLEGWNYFDVLTQKLGWIKE